MQLTQGLTTTQWDTWYSTTSNRIGGVAENSVANRAFSHDAAGNISSDDRNGTVYGYAYNARGRLSNLTVGGNQRGAYVYDAFKRLSIRTVTSGGASTVIHTVQDRGGRIIAEATGAGATSREYIWLDDMPIAVVADVDTSTPKLWFVHADHLDRPILMTDGAKASVWEAVWKPWGAPHGITGTASLNMRFPGQWFQAESGLHYNWHRQYDPTTGRYVKADPIADVLATQPVDLNDLALIANSGVRDGLQLAVSIASAPNTGGRIGAELPTFTDGPNIYNYAKSAPSMFVDPDGTQATLIRPAIKIATYCWRFPDLCVATVKAGVDACLAVYNSKHTKGRRPSTEGKHEEGQARKQRDRGGEKADARRAPPRKPPSNWKGKWPLSDD